MEHLLTVWPQVVDQFNRAAGVLLMSDFDGTLAPIGEKPDLVFIDPSIRDLIRSMTTLPRFRVGIISGRALADLKTKIGLDDVIYAGNHGFEIEGPGLHFVNSQAHEVIPYFQVLRQALTLALASFNGAWIEDKGLTLSVHYRQAATADIPEIEARVIKTVKGTPVGCMVDLTPGKKVIDLKPSVRWDKGKAIRLLMKKFSQGGRHSGLLPVYLGDDITDEDGFKVIEKYGHGITVFVGDPLRESEARYFLRSPDEVKVFLSQILGSVERGRLCVPYSTT